MKTKIVVVVFFLMCAIAANAQFTLKGELRPRTEYSHGYKTLANGGQDASIFTSQRTRINLGFTSDVVVSKIVLQDVRVWGAQPQLVNNEDFAVSIHEAWAEVPLFGNVSVKAGRQEVAYDDHRILGSVGWAQQARSHDMAILKFESGINAHLGLALNQNTNRSNNLYDGPDAYKAMQFLWMNKKLDKVSLSLLALNNGVPLTSDNGQDIVYSQTIGSHIKVEASQGLMFSINAYYQGGNIVYSGARTPLAAYNVMAEANYKLAGWSWSVGYELLSGNNSGENSKVQAFTPLYGTNHKFNGHMDYFYVGNHINSVGLNDIYLKAARLIGKGTVNMHVHAFSGAQEVGATGNRFLGTEIDCSYAYKLSDVTQFAVGYSQMIASEGMVNLKGGVANQMHNWAYLMFTFQPNFLN